MHRISKLLAATAAALTLAACSSQTDTGTAPTVKTATTSPSAAPPMSAASGPAASTPTAPTADGQTPVTLIVGGRTITATLNGSAVSRDFAVTLPVTLPWFRNGSIEFITGLSAPLTETGPFYTDVQPGDVGYYNPRDSLTIIYEPTSSVPTLTKMSESPPTSASSVTSGTTSTSQSRAPERIREPARPRRRA